VTGKMSGDSATTHADYSRGDGVFSSVYLSVFRTISQKLMQLESPNLTQKCSTMSPGNPFTLGSKGQWSRSRVAKTTPARVFALLWVLTSP